MSISVLAKKIIQQRKFLSLYQEEVIEERRQEKQRRKKRNAASSAKEQDLQEPRPSPTAAPLQYSALERYCIKATWARLSDYKNKRRTQRLFSECFESTFAHSVMHQVPANYMKRAFTRTKPSTVPVRTKSVSCQWHGQCLYAIVDEFVDTMVKQAPGTTYYVQGLKQIAEVHMELASSGFRPAVFEKFGDFLIDRFLLHEFVMAHPMGKRAWMKLFACIVQELYTTYNTLIIRRKERERTRRAGLMLQQSNQDQEGPKPMSDKGEARPPMSRTVSESASQAVDRFRTIVGRMVIRNPVEQRESAATTEPQASGSGPKSSPPPVVVAQPEVLIRIEGDDVTIMLGEKLNGLGRQSEPDEPLEVAHEMALMPRPQPRQPPQQQPAQATGRRSQSLGVAHPPPVPAVLCGQWKPLTRAPTSVDTITSLLSK